MRVDRFYLDLLLFEMSSEDLFLRLSSHFLGIVDREQRTEAMPPKTLAVKGMGCVQPIKGLSVSYFTGGRFFFFFLII